MVLYFKKWTIGIFNMLFNYLTCSFISHKIVFDSKHTILRNPDLLVVSPENASLFYLWITFLKLISGQLIWSTILFYRGTQNLQPPLSTTNVWLIILVFHRIISYSLNWTLYRYLFGILELIRRYKHVKSVFVKDALFMLNKTSLVFV